MVEKHVVIKRATKGGGGENQKGKNESLLKKIFFSPFFN